MASVFKHRNLPHLLLRARKTSMARFQLILRERGITEQQWRVLRTLNGIGDMEPNQLANAYLVLNPSPARMLAAVKQSETIVHTKPPVDQCRQVVSLTLKSRQFLANVEPQVGMGYARIEAQLSHAWLDALYAAIDESIQVMETHTSMGRLIGDE